MTRSRVKSPRQKWALFSLSLYLAEEGSLPSSFPLPIFPCCLSRLKPNTNNLTSVWTEEMAGIKSLNFFRERRNSNRLSRARLLVTFLLQMPQGVRCLLISLKLYQSLICKGGKKFLKKSLNSEKQGTHICPGHFVTFVCINIVLYLCAFLQNILHF